MRLTFSHYAELARNAARAVIESDPLPSPAECDAQLAALETCAAPIPRLVIEPNPHMRPGRLFL